MSCNESLETVGAAITTPHIIVNEVVNKTLMLW